MFLADFHVHSKYSRATSRDLDLEHLYIAAQRKGVTVVGTGDFTHPGWFSEICEKLISTGTGLFELRPEIAARCAAQVPESCRRTVRFLLTAEISNIYKKNERTRKNHNLIFIESLQAAEAFNRQLDRVGNIASDGRPILGLDARDLLEILLSVSDTGFLVPAHIWTPWFSLFGSKSGFDRLDECFEDLSDEIFAVETGLSSDPPMNWRVSDLDRLTLISNSDAHSPGKLAREATCLACELSYPDIRESLKTGDPDRFLGTVEFYPEEGKYHFDGHRKCGVRLAPQQSRAFSEKCPHCGRPLTLGVLHRVEQLADRPDGRRPDRGRDFLSLVPLQDILSELLEVGPQTKKVAAATELLLQRFGSEFEILWDVEPERLDKAPVPLLGEAMRRMRTGRISVTPGYDGEFGTVRVFDPQERRRLSKQGNLFTCPGPNETAGEISASRKKVADSGKRLPPAAGRCQQRPSPPRTDPLPPTLNPAQQKVLRAQNPALLVVAGPGTGKTHTLICRIAHMVSNRNVPGRQILAVTFTNQAAKEMAQRLSAMGIVGDAPAVMTFHGFCLAMLQAHGRMPGALIDEEAVRLQITEAVRLARAQGWKITAPASSFGNRIAALKQRHLPSVSPDPDRDPALGAVHRCYERLLQVQGLCDYEDLILHCARLLEKESAFRAAVCGRFHHLLIDEYQDLNPGQYRLVRLLAPAATAERTICAIGDPNQSIYGFRGSDAGFFQRFSDDYPDAEVVALSRNYRSTETIVRAAGQIVSDDRRSKDALFSGIKGLATIDVFECRSDTAEAVTVGRMIEQEVGGTGFHSVDFGKVDSTVENERSFADFAVLVRTGAQMDIFEAVLTDAGIPVTSVRKQKTYDGPLRKWVSLMRLLFGHPMYADVAASVALFDGGIGKSTLAAFFAWAFENGLPARRALDTAWKIPIAAMSRAGQNRLCRAYRHCMALSSQLAGLTVAEALSAAAEKTGLADAIRAEQRTSEPFDRLIEDAAANDLSMEAMLGRLALETDTDALGIRSEAVSILTMHGAKGLEFPVVFIAGCEEGFIPMTTGDESRQRCEEEKRLFYVAMTRAKERLVLCWSRKRRIHGRVEDRRLSPFAVQIESDLLRLQRPPKQPPPAERQHQLELFT